MGNSCGNERCPEPATAAVDPHYSAASFASSRSHGTQGRRHFRTSSTTAVAESCGRSDPASCSRVDGTTASGNSVLERLHDTELSTSIDSSTFPGTDAGRGAGCFVFHDAATPRETDGKTDGIEDSPSVGEPDGATGSGRDGSGGECSEKRTGAEDRGGTRSCCSGSIPATGTCDSVRVVASEAGINRVAESVVRFTDNRFEPYAATPSESVAAVDRNTVRGRESDLAATGQSVQNGRCDSADAGHASPGSSRTRRSVRRLPMRLDRFRRERQDSSGVHPIEPTLRSSGAERV